MILPREGAAMKERLSLMREVCLYLVIFLILFAYLFPLIWQLSTSLKTMDEVFRGFSLIPSKPIWENYTVALRDFNVGAYLLNTMLVAGLITVGQVISCSMAGYAFAKLRFPGRDFIFFLYLGTMMIPATVTLIPELHHHFEPGLDGFFTGPGCPLYLWQRLRHLLDPPISAGRSKGFGGGSGD